MEIGRNQHLHYISAIKGGKVVKSLNVSKGGPSLSFKELSTILNHGSNAQTIPLADRSSSNEFNPNMVNSEVEVFNNNCTGGSSNRRSQDSDDSFTGEMTLREMKKKCKANKGKITRLGAKEVEPDSGGSHLYELNVDLAETLGSLKRKVPGKCYSRKKRKCKSLLEITGVVVKCEPVSFNEASTQVGSGFDMCASATIKIEDSDDSMLNEHHATAKSVRIEIPACEEMMDADDDPRIIEGVGSELPKANADFCSPREESLFVAEVCKVSTLDQTCYEFREHSGDQSSRHGEALKVGDSEMGFPCKVTSKMQLTGEICTAQKDSIIFVQGANVTNADLMSDEHHKPANSLPSEIPTCEEVMMVNGQGISKMGSNKRHTTAKSLPPEIPACEDVMVVNDQGIIEIVSNKRHTTDRSLPPEIPSCEEVMVVNDQGIIEMVSNKRHTTYRSLHPEIPAREEVMVVSDQEIIEKVAIRLLDVNCCSSRKESSTIAKEPKDCTLNQICYELEDHPGDPCLASESRSHEHTLKVGDRVMVAEQPISIPALTQESKAVTDALICKESPDILFTSDCNKDDKIPSFLGKSVNTSPNSVLKQKTRPVPVMAVAGSVELHHHPERLLSARKTISPDSQQKLCMAMESLDLPDLKETEKCKQRLCFEKHEVNGASSDADKDNLYARLSAPEHSDTGDILPNSEHKKKRGKEDKIRVRSKGVNKVAPPSWYRISSACGCIQSCSQNVIDFSQQQMIDTERLAVNLTKELRSMKELMIDMLQPQGKRVATSRNNINEVRVAVENATKVEETARRFIAGMTRDCNRFCKIVSLAEKNTMTGNNAPDKEEAPENDATKGKKKITFADESGGNLCNVRLIQDNESLPVENGELDSA